MIGLEQTVVLVRHGDALSKTEDPARSLSAAGRARAERTARWLAGLGLGVTDLSHSGKTRAQQTAEIIAHRLGVDGDRLRAVSGIAPHDDPAPVARALEAERRSVCLVGHLPFMGRLAGQLLVGDADRLGVRFSDAAALVLSRDAAAWQLVAFVAPEHLG